jgi:hypothetical protein
LHWPRVSAIYAEIVDVIGSSSSSRKKKSKELKKCKEGVGRLLKWLKASVVPARTESRGRTAADLVGEVQYAISTHTASRYGPVAPSA